MTEIYAPTIDAIKDFLDTPDGREVAANAAKISTGGPPAVIFAEDDTYQL